MGNITKDGRDHDLQLCSFIEAAGVLVEGRKGDLELISEHSARCEAALGPSDSLSALGRLLEATALVRAGKEEEARAVLDKAGKGMAGKCTTVEYAGGKGEIFGMLSRLALSAGDLGVAKEAASACLQAAEAVNDNSKTAVLPPHLRLSMHAAVVGLELWWSFKVLIYSVTSDYFDLIPLFQA